jgi:hypothetical protein
MLLTRWRRPTARSGSTPGCNTPTASPARPRATGSRRPRHRASPKTPTTPTAIPSRTPASSSRWNDDLVNEGGIMDLWVREARLFKYGSGTGTNFSHLRGDGEPLSGGGKSSGLMSFLKIGDRAAGAIKSGGTTRRAAKMVCLDPTTPTSRSSSTGRSAKSSRSRRWPRASSASTSARRRRNWASARLRLQRRGLRDRQRPELQQLGAHPRRFLRGRGRGRRLGAARPHRRRRASSRSRPGTCGTRSATPRGAAPTPACSSTRPSTTGTPARRAAGSTRATRAASTCSSTTRRATWRRSTC